MVVALTWFSPLASLEAVLLGAGLDDDDRVTDRLLLIALLYRVLLLTPFSTRGAGGGGGHRAKAYSVVIAGALPSPYRD
jgi:hypothetical protein